MSDNQYTVVFDGGIREIVLRELLLKIRNDYSAALMPEDIANIDAALKGNE
jgi:hypothetical protein